MSSQPTTGREARDGADMRLPPDMTPAEVLLDVRELSVVHESAGQTAVQTVDHVSCSLRQGEFVGPGRVLLRHVDPGLRRHPAAEPAARTNGGSIVFGGADGTR